MTSRSEPAAAKASTRKRGAAKRTKVRFGRPPKELAGEVDTRILDAARKMFLERGFEGASIDEIAEVARSGKATIYARFRDKRALFTEVVTRDILSRITEFKALAVAEARRFPDLASTVSRTARDLSTDLGVRLLGELTQSDELRSLPAFAPERLTTTARFFLDLVAVPMLLRALFEVDLKTLDEEIDAHVARSVAFFLAACRHGSVS